MITCESDEGGGFRGRSDLPGISCTAPPPDSTDRGVTPVPKEAPIMELLAPVEMLAPVSMPVEVE